MEIGITAHEYMNNSNIIINISLNTRGVNANTSCYLMLINRAINHKEKQKSENEEERGGLYNHRVARPAIILLKHFWRENPQGAQPLRFNV